MQRQGKHLAYRSNEAEAKRQPEERRIIIRRQDRLALRNEIMDGKADRRRHRDREQGLGSRLYHTKRGRDLHPCGGCGASSPGGNLRRSDQFDFV